MSMDFYQRVLDIFHNNIDITMQSLDELAEPVFHAADAVTQCLLSERKVICCGEGQSGALSQIFVSNLLNRFDYERPSLPAISLPTDTTTLSAIATDGSYSDIFSKQIRALGQPGDVLLALSNGTNSATLQSIQAAHDREMLVIAICRQSQSDINALMLHEDIDIQIPSDRRARVAEVQLLILNSICELIDNQLFGHGSD